MGPLVASYGVGYLFYAVILSGMMEVVYGMLRIHKMLKFVTFPVKLGFLNALAIVIFDAQKHSFYKPRDHSVEETELAHEYITGTPLYLMITLAVIALVINLLPFKKLQRLPLALISIVVCTVLEWALIRLKFSTTLVQDMADLSAGFPNIIFFRKSSYEQLNDKARTVLPPLNMLATWEQIVPLAFFLAMIGIVESLMTLEAIDGELCDKNVGKTTDKKKSGFLSAMKNVFLNNPGEPASAQQEVIAQGVGNMLSGLFGTMGGCAMIGQSMINVQNGGDKKLSSVLAGFFTLLVIIGLSPVIGLIPLGSLVGVMVCVSYHTFEFSSLGWMLNSLVGGGRTFFGLLKSDGCVSTFFYGKEEESATDSKKYAPAEIEHLAETKDGEPSKCKVSTDDEAKRKVNNDDEVKRKMNTDDEVVGMTSEAISHDELQLNAAVKHPLKSGVSKKVSPLNETHPSSISIGDSKCEGIEATRNEEKLSDMNIMDTLVIVLTIVLTIKTNLAIAVLAGAVASNLERYIRNRFLSQCVQAYTDMSNTRKTMMKEKRNIR